jgi:hypothetical protein
MNFKDVEAVMGAEAAVADLEAQARSAIWMVGILVNRLGGEVTITQADMNGVMGYRLARIEDPQTMTLTLRLERAHPDV